MKIPVTTYWMYDKQLNVTMTFDYYFDCAQNTLVKCVGVVPNKHKFDWDLMEEQDYQDVLCKLKNPI